jgi:hypothetical protein
MKRMKRLCFLNLCLSVFVCGSSSVFAAPPSLTSLFPAGGQRGTSVEVTAAGTFDPWPVSVWVSGKGVRVEPGKAKGKMSVTIAADAVPGVYWLRAHSADGASGLRPFVVGTLPEVAEKEPNDDAKKPQVIDKPAVVVNGKLDKPGDVDCYALTLKKGETLVASVEAHHTFRSPMDGVLQIVSADGFVLTENNDTHGLDPQLAFTAPADGTYVARVFAFPSTPDSSIRFFGSDTCIYRLTLTTGGFADYPMPLAVSWAEPGSVRAVGWNVPSAAEKLSVIAAPPGEDMVSVSHPGLANALRVRLEPHPVFTAPVPPDKPLVPPFSLSARLEKPGVFTVPVAAKKGQPLTIQVLSESLGLPTVPAVRVLGPDRALFTRAEPSKLHNDLTLTYPPTADAPLTVEVRDLFNGHGPRHAFLLRVTPPTPDFTLTVPADRVALTPGKPADVKVTVAKLGGLKDDVLVTAEGLPDGVKAEIVPEAKPTPGAVTLRFSSEAAVNASFRIVGRVKDKPELVQVARAPLAEFETATADLWLTPAAAPAAPPKKKRG